tara:strand:- start:4608 stop:4949 length:342 start_codon:yes stop_codon:yes gene_type:complete
MSIAIEETTETKEKIEPPKKYNLWALDNDFTSFDEVVAILVNAFKMEPSVAGELTRKVDREGKAKVNPKPMSRDVAKAQLDKVNTVKRYLADNYLGGIRKKQIMMLKFIIKED